MSWVPGELRSVEIGTPRKLARRDAYQTKYHARQVPAPYDRIICQLLAEDRHGEANGGHEARRRQSYARRVLDKFVVELKAYDGPAADFRSYVLSPILARQLLGVPDSYANSLLECVSSLAPDDIHHNIESAVSIGDATEFYLAEDPTDPELIPQYRMNMLTIVEAMWHLSVVMGAIPEGSGGGYNSVQHHHDRLMEDLKGIRWLAGNSGGQGENPRFNVFEVEMIIACRVEAFFAQELELVVCPIRMCILSILLTPGSKPGLVARVREDLSADHGPGSAPAIGYSVAGKRPAPTKRGTQPTQDTVPPIAGPSTLGTSNHPIDTPKRARSDSAEPSSPPPRVFGRRKRFRTQETSDGEGSPLTTVPSTSEEPEDERVHDSDDERPAPAMSKILVPETQPEGSSDSGELTARWHFGGLTTH